MQMKQTHGRQGCDRFRLLQRQGIAKAAPEEAYFVRNMQMEVVPRDMPVFLISTETGGRAFLLR